jgi:hypothetical protein
VRLRSILSGALGICAGSFIFWLLTGAKTAAPVGYGLVLGYVWGRLKS